MADQRVHSTQECTYAVFSQMKRERDEAKQEALAIRAELSKVQQLYLELEQEFGALNVGSQYRWHDMRSWVVPS